MLIRALAPAKINLTLEILGRREDGYHDVDTIIQSISLYDLVSIEEINSTEIKIVCNKPLNCRYEENIVYKAAKSFFKYNNISRKGICIQIEKKIPICAGLAGGSSDGAAVIVILNKMFGTNLSEEQMKEIATEVGADVPFCISGGTVRATGVGTHLCAIRNSLNYGIALIKPKCDILTKEAFSLFDKYGNKHNSDKKSTTNIINYIKKGEVKTLSENLFNNFELFISNEEIDNAKKQILKYDPLGVCMSGSGPSVFGIFKDLKSAEECVKGLEHKYGESFACVPLESGIKII